MIQAKKYEKLRLSVLAGMEQYEWVNQKVLNESSLQFYDYIFPRTKTKAVLKLAIQIACLDHDRNIQASRAHLFRLPQYLEQILASQSDVSFKIDDPVKELESLSMDIAIEPNKGPIHIGTTSELDEGFMIPSLAKHYAEAFKNNYKTYPYFT